MDANSVVSYRELEFSVINEKVIAGSDVCINCAHVFAEQDIRGKVNLFCNVAKQRPRSGNVERAEEIFDYYDKDKYEAQQLAFDNWKKSTLVSPIGTCDNFERMANETSD